MKVATFSFGLLIAISSPSISQAQASGPPSGVIHASQPNPLAQPTPDQHSGSKDDEIIKGSFAQLPDAEQFAALYPEKAMRLGVNGIATLSCKVDQGLLIGCSVLRETPPGLGFGDASLRAAKLFKLNAKDFDGIPVQGRIFQPNISWKAP